MINVLVPVDGSESSARAVQMVIEIYRRLAPVQVRLLHVQIADGVPKAALDAPAAHPGDGHESERALEPAQRLFERAGVPYTSGVRGGYVPSAIVEYARAMRCDAIIMGTRGMGSTADVVGSIARQVISLSEIPVTLVK